MTEYSKSAWHARIALARLGLHTDSRLTTSGIRNESGHERAYGLWAKSWYWQGWISEITVHDHAIIDLRDEEDCLRQIRRCHHRVQEAVERGLREFPDSIPCLSHEKRDDGMLGLVENSWAMENTKGRSREFYPTELIPEGVEVSACSSVTEDLVRAQLGNARMGLDVEDRLNTYTGRSRYTHDCKDRDWHFVQRIAVRNSAGQRVTFRPRDFTSNLLSETSVSTLARSTGHMMVKLFEDYAPGGIQHGATENALPPGFMTLDEFQAQREREKVERGHSDDEDLDP